MLAARSAKKMFSCMSQYTLVVYAYKSYTSRAQREENVLKYEFFGYLKSIFVPCRIFVQLKSRRPGMLGQIGAKVSRLFAALKMSRKCSPPVGLLPLVFPRQRLFPHIYQETVKNPIYSSFGKKKARKRQREILIFLYSYFHIYFINKTKIFLINRKIETH